MRRLRFCTITEGETNEDCDGAADDLVKPGGSVVRNGRVQALVGAADFPPLLFEAKRENKGTKVNCMRI